MDDESSDVVVKTEIKVEDEVFRMPQTPPAQPEAETGAGTLAQAAADAPQVNGTHHDNDSNAAVERTEQEGPHPEAHVGADGDDSLYEDLDAEGDPDGQYEDDWDQDNGAMSWLVEGQTPIDPTGYSTADATAAAPHEPVEAELNDAEDPNQHGDREASSPEATTNTVVSSPVVDDISSAAEAAPLASSGSDPIISAAGDELTPPVVDGSAHSIPAAPESSPTAPGTSSIAFNNHGISAAEAGSDPLKEDALPSPNRISISYAASMRRLVLDADMVDSVKIKRGEGRIDVVLNVRRAAGSEEAVAVNDTETALGPVGLAEEAHGLEGGDTQFVAVEQEGLGPVVASSSGSETLESDSGSGSENAKEAAKAPAGNSLQASLSHLAAPLPISISSQSQSALTKRELYGILASLLFSNAPYRERSFTGYGCPNGAFTDILLSSLSSRSPTRCFPDLSKLIPLDRCFPRPFDG